ncbi:MAG: hypothetical protein MUC62_07250 [Candidatus Thermoplasmatota archaeon]|nr:hypothetical protein [Candidatus Thermoplasmatota archaeon]
MGRSNLRVKLRRIGTGQGILISSAICQLMGVKVGDDLLMELDDRGVLLKAIEGDRDEKG